MRKLVNEKAVRDLVHEVRPGLRISKHFCESLNYRVRALVKDAAHRNGGKRILYGDTLNGIPSNAPK